MKIKRMVLSASVVFFLNIVNSSANVNQIKAYKKVFSDAKSKCINCHIDEKPKKEAGKHDLNAYGKKVIEANPKTNGRNV